MVYRTHPQGSLVERELSAKLTEGLRREISRICPTFGEFAILSRAILPALRATSLYTREASSGCGGKDETPYDIAACACGRGDPISHGPRPRQLPQRESQGAAAQGRAVNDCLYGVERESVRNSRRGEVTPPYERNSALHPLRIVHLVKFWRVDLWTSPKIGRDREVVLASFLRVWYTGNGLDRFFRCNIFYLGGLL